MSDNRIQPLTPQALAGLIAARAGACAVPHPVRVVIDGPIPDEAVDLAQAVADELGQTGRQAVVIAAQGFLRPRSIRLETGPDDPDAGYWRWYDHQAIRREVLEPAVRHQVLPSLWDPERDRATRAQPLALSPDAVVLVAGPLLLRTELADAVDLAVHLQVSERGLQRRVDLPDLERVLGAWRQYLEWDHPQDRGDLLIRADRPSHPAVEHRTTVR